MTKLDKKLREVIKLDELEIDGYVSDKILSQIKQVILEEIMKDEVVNYKWRGWRKGYIVANFVRSSDIKNLLTDTDRNLK